MKQQDELYSKQLCVQKKMLGLLKDHAQVERQKKMKEILVLQKKIKAVKLEALKLRRESLQSIITAATATATADVSVNVVSGSNNARSNDTSEEGAGKEVKVIVREDDDLDDTTTTIDKRDSSSNSNKVDKKNDAATKDDFKTSMYEEYDEPVDFEDESSDEDCV